jgi:flagellar protein FliL
MKKSLVMSLFAILLLATSCAFASEGGEGGGGGGLYAKLGTFTVNLQNISEFLQIDISVKMPNPGMLEAVKTYLPFIKHELILLLSSQDSKQLASVAGKQKLMEQTKIAVNKVLKLDPKEGITDVLFESFVIQQ